jgi:hypothetical protein
MVTPGSPFMSTARKRQADVDEETGPILDLIDEVILKPRDWINIPNENLGGERPIDLIGTDKEGILRNLTRAIKHGMFS